MEHIFCNRKFGGNGCNRNFLQKLARICPFSECNQLIYNDLVFFNGRIEFSKLLRILQVLGDCRLGMGLITRRSGEVGGIESHTIAPTLCPVRKSGNTFQSLNLLPKSSNIVLPGVLLFSFLTATQIRLISATFYGVIIDKYLYFFKIKIVVY